MYITRQVNLAVSDTNSSPRPRTWYELNDSRQDLTRAREFDLVIANGAANVRLEPWIGSSGNDVATIKYLVVESDKAVTLQLGGASGTTWALTPGDSGVGSVQGDFVLARDATNGLRVSNASGADARVRGFIAGT